MLAVGALVASILAAGASPAAATMHNPDLTAEWSACVGAAGSNDADFPDVDADNAHAGAINCIAYYGITVGKSDGSYGPDDNVTALHMRLFVERAARLMGADGEAVLAAVELSDEVTRLEMAKLMFGLVDDIRDDVRINRDGEYQVDSNDDNVWEDVDDYFADARRDVPIADSDLIGATYELGITMGRSANVSTDDSVFAPSDPVTRAQMASFITRALDHSNLRPAGLAIQRNNNKETQVSYRDADFAPIDDARIDVISSLYPEDAFDEDDGECVSRFTKDESSSFEKCEIDIGDQQTDDDGNVTFELESDSDPITADCETGGVFTFKTAVGSSDERTFWAWTGDLGDELDSDTTRAKLESVDRPLGRAAPDHAHITGGLPTGAELAKMGETVTFNVQIRTGGDDPQPIGPDRSRNPYHLTITWYFVTASESTPHTASDAQTGQSWDISEDLPGDWDFAEADPRGGTNPQVRESVDVAQGFYTFFDNIVNPNPDGEFPINLVFPDSEAAENNDDVLVRFTLRPFIPGTDTRDANLLPRITADPKANHAEGNTIAGNPLTDNPQASGYALFSDNPVEATTVSAKSTASYRIVRSASTSNSVTVTVNDQYGDGYRNAGISVLSSLDNSVADDDRVRYPEEVDITIQSGENNQDGTGSDSDTVGTFNTRRNGTYRIGYNLTGDDPAVETITPSVAEIPDDPATTNVNENVPAINGTGVTVYFADVGTRIESDYTTDGTAEAVDVLVADVASRALVVDVDTGTGDTEVDPEVYYYDEEDTFVVGNTGATFEMFEEALMAFTEGTKITAVDAQWESYEFDRPRDRAIWELEITCPSGDA